MLNHNLKYPLSRPFSTTFPAVTTVARRHYENEKLPMHNISLRLNTILLGYDPFNTNSIFIPHSSENKFFANLRPTLEPTGFPVTLYNSDEQSFHTLRISQEQLGKLGDEILKNLKREMNDTERIYNYKLLVTFFEHCIDKIDTKFIEKYCSQLCKDVFNYNREVGYQLITNLLFVLKKLKSEKNYYTLVLREILSKQFISLFIMYKTWRNSKIREQVLDLLDVTQRDLFLMEMKKDQVCAMSPEVKKEIELLESLREHICIREDVKEKLKKVFK